MAAQRRAPPEYPSNAVRDCGYCGTQHSHATFKQHLMENHSSFVFVCQECDMVVDRNDFFLHMSLHAVEYSTREDMEAARYSIKRERPYALPIQVKVENDMTPDSMQNIKIEINEPSEVRNSMNGREGQETEFSDPSDAENGLEPLPESVFEAIEDNQPADNNGSSQAAEEGPEESGSSNQEKEEPPKAKRGRNHKKSRTCQLCNKECKASSSYFYHMKHFHKRSKEHECDVCGKRFGTKACLVQHKTVHSNVSPYECKECTKKFRSKASLYIHKQTHVGVKGWSCQQCQRSFRWKTHLLRHAKRHADEKNNVCEICGRGFSVHCDLLRHARTHAAGNYSCQKCGVKFAQMRYLKAHMEKKHSSKKKEVAKKLRKA